MTKRTIARASLRTTIASISPAPMRASASRAPTGVSVSIAFGSPPAATKICPMVATTKSQAERRPSLPPK
jgi:hypothetical protein